MIKNKNYLPGQGRWSNTFKETENHEAISGIGLMHVNNDDPHAHAEFLKKETLNGFGFVNKQNPFISKEKTLDEKIVRARMAKNHQFFREKLGSVDHYGIPQKFETQDEIRLTRVASQPNKNEKRKTKLGK